MRLYDFGVTFVVFAGLAAAIAMVVVAQIA
jgi:hypothetical protein